MHVHTAIIINRVYHFCLLTLKRYVATRLITMFGVLMITLLITIALVGSNMDNILKQGIGIQVRTEITENPKIIKSFSTVDEFESLVRNVA